MEQKLLPIISLSWDKWTTGQAKNQAKGQDSTGRDSQNSGWDGLGQPKSKTGHRTKQDRAEKDILKQENNILKQKIMFSDNKGCSKRGNLVIFLKKT